MYYDDLSQKQKTKQANLTITGSWQALPIVSTVGGSYQPS
jgi:hypothetical protein